MVDAWVPIVARWPNARLLLLGDGPRRAALVQHVGTRRLNHRVALPGAFDDLDGLLPAADLFVSPARDTGAPLALLEAMAAGLPVVATDTAGHRELIEHDRHGLLVPAYNSGALAGAVRRVLSDPELASRLGSAARDRVRQDYSLARCAAEHRDLFERVIAEKSHNSS